MYTILFDEAEARGEARGEIKGAIKEAIRIYDKEMGMMPSDIEKKIMLRFSLSEEEADRYLEEVLDLVK